LAHADRGKPRWREDFSDRDPSVPTCSRWRNHNTDDLVRRHRLAARVTQTIIARQAFVSDLVARLVDGFQGGAGPIPLPDHLPFFYPVVVDCDAITCSKIEFAEAVRAEGSTSIRTTSSRSATGPTSGPFADGFDVPNAHDICNRSFNLYLNEKYGEQEAKDTVAAIRKVEGHFAKT
jgi:hypothetical protein